MILIRSMIINSSCARAARELFSFAGTEDGDESRSRCGGLGNLDEIPCRNHTIFVCLRAGFELKFAGAAVIISLS